MLIFSKNFILSPAERLAPGTPLIGWHNIITTENLTAGTADVEYPVENLTNPSTVQRWQAADTTNQRIIVDADYGGDVDYMAIGRHNLCSANVPISVESRETADDEWEVLVEPFVAAHDKPIMIRMPSIWPAEIALRLHPGSAPARIAVLNLGRLLVMERGIDIESSPTPFAFGRVNTIAAGRPMSGDFLGRIVTGAHSESTAEFKHLRRSFYYTRVQPFVEAAAERPFFYVADPIEYPNDVAYAELETDPRPTLDPDTRRMNVRLQMRGVLR